MFYVDDLKLVAKKFSDDIRMKSGIDKCATFTIINGKITGTSEMKLDAEKATKELGQGRRG